MSCSICTTLERRSEPVAEEFRESTWEEFKEISNEIHERKAELVVQVEKLQNENLEKKNNIIAQIARLQKKARMYPPAIGKTLSEK
jgi:flagellar biosynthesis/type III secretory pathway chaperone